jgi:hypothetical protein
MQFSESAPQITPGTGLKTKAPRKKNFVGLCNARMVVHDFAENYSFA